MHKDESGRNGRFRRAIRIPPANADAVTAKIRSGAENSPARRVVFVDDNDANPDRATLLKARP